MWAVIRVAIKKNIGYGVDLHIDDYVDVGEKEVAAALRGMVRSAYGQDDAGVDYFYDATEGVVSIGGQPGWWDSRQPVHIQLLQVADLLDGSNFSFDYKMALAEQETQI